MRGESRGSGDRAGQADRSDEGRPDVLIDVQELRNRYPGGVEALKGFMLAMGVAILFGALKLVNLERYAL